MHKYHLIIIRVYFLLAFIESLIATTRMLSIPSGSNQDWFSGVSPGRFVLIIPLALLTVIFAWIFVSSLRNNQFLEALTYRFISFTRHDTVYWVSIGISALIFCISIYCLALGMRVSDAYINAYVIRITPIVGLAALLSIQNLIAIRIMRFGVDLSIFKLDRSIFIVTVVIFSLLLLLSGWIIKTKIGLSPDLVGWGVPGAPILAYQVFAALVITFTSLILGSLLVHLYKNRVSKPAYILKSHWLDWLIYLVLWSIAIWLWSCEPMRPSYFSPTPLPPNFEYYPYSDAGNYDISAQNLLIGYGLGNDVTRPVYSLFLALVQGLSGIGYSTAVQWQIIVLANIPPLLYLLTKILHHRLSGILVGILAILHEINSISLSGRIEVSNVKMLMSDLPTMLGVILFTLAIVIWLKNPRYKRVYAIFAGGILAVFALIRIQIVLILPFVILAAWLILRKTPHWRKDILLLLGMFIIVLMPWIWRNWNLTGKMVFTETAQTSQVGLIGKRYSNTLETVPRQPEETEDEYLSRITTNAVEFFVQHPNDAIGFIVSHFTHNQIATLFTLPTFYPLIDNLKISQYNLQLWQEQPWVFWDQCCTVESHINVLPYWENTWDGSLAKTSRLPLFTSLLLVSIGIGATWNKLHVIALVPLLVNIGYSLSNALVRNSGWRFNLPIDWIAILYYGIGLMQVCFWIGMFFINRKIPPPSERKETDRTLKPFQPKWAIFVGIILVMITFAIPLLEWGIPARYKDHNIDTIIASLDHQGLLEPAGLDNASVEEFLSQDNAVGLVGRGLYPRYYLAGQGEPGSSWPNYAPREYNRLGFFLIGPDHQPIVLPMENAPAQFPNAADIFVLGCLIKDNARGDFVHAYLVANLNEPITIYFGSILDGWKCTS